MVLGAAGVAGAVTYETDRTQPLQMRQPSFVYDEVKLFSKYNPAQQVAGISDKIRKPRICMPTFRNFTKRAFRCGLYESQDVLVEIDDVDLIDLEMSWGRWLKESWLRNPLYHDISRKLMFVNPGLKGVRLTRDYDLFIAVCQDFWDLPYLNAIHCWRDFCKTSVCWLDEIWAATIPGYKHWLHALDQFDYIFVGCKDSVAALSKAINRPCYWLPGAVDTIRFSPFPHLPVALLTYKVSDEEAKASTESCSMQQSGARFLSLRHVCG